MFCGILLRKTACICVVLSFLISELTTKVAATWLHDIIYTTFSETEIPTNPEGLKYQRFMGGIGGGVHVFQDSITHQKYTLKSWISVGHCVSEKLGALLLQKLGVPIPKFCLFKTLPDCLKYVNMEERFLAGNFFCLSEFIEGPHPSREFSLSYLIPYFSAIAFVGFYDYHQYNLIIGQENLIFLIDTGGSLLHDAKGNLKKQSHYWSADEIKELNAFRFGEFILSFPKYKVTNQLIHDQLRIILPKAGMVLQTADDFCGRCQYSNHVNMLQMLYARLNYAQKWVDPTAQPLYFDMPILSQPHHEEELSPICQAYEQNNILEIWRLLQKNPHLRKTRYLQNPDTLKWIELENTYVGFLDQATAKQVEVLSLFIDTQMTTSDVQLLLTAAIQDIPDATERENVLMYAQQFKTKTVRKARHVLSAISKIPQELREGVVCYAKKCITEQMDGDHVAQIIRKIHTINPDVRENILHHAQQCITAQMSVWGVEDVLTTIEEIKEENRLNVVSYVREFVSMHLGGEVGGNLLEIIDSVPISERGAIVFYAKQCITEKTRAIDVADIVRRIYKIPVDYRQDIVERTNNLVARTKIDGSSMDMIMKQIYKIPQENRNDILELVIKLIVPRMNGEGVAKIMKTIRRIPLDNLDDYKKYIHPQLQDWCRIHGIVSGFEISEKIEEIRAQMIIEKEDGSWRRAENREEER